MSSQTKRRMRSPLRHVINHIGRGSIRPGLNLLSKIALLLVIFQGLTLATTLDHIEVNGVKVPLIYEEANRLPMVSMQLVFRNGGSITDGTLPGLAKLSAKMMNEGTLGKGSIGFAQALDAKAIHFSANTGTETFVLEVGALKEEFSAAATAKPHLCLSRPDRTLD